MNSRETKQCLAAVLDAAERLSPYDLSMVSEVLDRASPEAWRVLHWLVVSVDHSDNPLDPDTWALALDAALARAAGLKISDESDRDSQWNGE